MRVHVTVVSFSLLFGSLLSRATTRNDLLARNNHPFDTAPSSVRRKEERCTGNLTSSLSLSLSLSLFLSLTARFLLLPYQRVDQGRESSVCPTSSAAMSASYVLSRYFAFPSPGSSRYVEDRLPSFLTYPYPFELAAHAYTHLHTGLSVPSRPILAIFRVSV